MVNALFIIDSLTSFIALSKVASNSVAELGLPLDSMFSVRAVSPAGSDEALSFPRLPLDGHNGSQPDR